MRIDGTGRIIATPGKSGSASARRGSETFRVEDDAQPARAARAGASMPGAGIDALLALQSVEDATSGKKKAIKRGNLLLDALEDIRANLLAGQVSEGRLNRAMALLTQAKNSISPELDALVADIELRVRVELAKLGKYPPL